MILERREYSTAMTFPVLRSTFTVVVTGTGIGLMPDGKLRMM
jgi:hypothetical protein